MYLHHIIATFTGYATLVFMNYAVVIGVLLLFTEISTTYVSLRWMIYTHKADKSTCGIINTVTLFFTFLFGRLIYQLWLVFLYGLPKLINSFETETMEWWEVTLILEISVAIFVSIIMNCFWMYLILN